VGFDNQVLRKFFSFAGQVLQSRPTEQMSNLLLLPDRFCNPFLPDGFPTSTCSGSKYGFATLFYRMGFATSTFIAGRGLFLADGVSFCRTGFATPSDRTDVQFFTLYMHISQPLKQFQMTFQVRV